MKISLISVDTEVALGLRSISAFLKREGYSCRLVFLPLASWSRGEYKTNYSQKVLANLVNLVRDSDIIGVSSMTSNANRAKRVIEFLKPLGIPIVWGGIHATVQSLDCLKYADMVCLGEGEEAFLNLVQCLEQRRDYSEIENFWFRKENQIITNPFRPLMGNLDTLPFLDYDLEDHYILRGQNILKMKEKDLKGQIVVNTSRGCPHSCSYCCNRYLRNLYQNKGPYIRKMNFARVIEELVELKKRFPSLRYLYFGDDAFLIRTIEELRFFSTEYKKRVAIPFECFTSPATVDKEKTELLISAGMVKIEIGIQSGSERINREIYKREISVEQVLNASRIINQYRNRMKIPNYHFIISNPYETREDIKSTIALLRRLPKPYLNQVFNLILLPGFELHLKAKSDGIIKFERDSAFDLDFFDTVGHLLIKKKNRYLNSLLYWMSGPVTKWQYGIIPFFLLPYLLREKIIDFNERFFRASLLLNRVVRFLQDTGLALFRLFGYHL
ncbi:MAG: radical SAM protein [Candidatus Edwardsbacteria bacterium]